MIRQATIADLPAMNDVALEFYEESESLHGFKIERFTALWTELLNCELGVIFVLDDGEIEGVIGGMVHPDAYGGDLVAEEFFWFVRKRSRGGFGAFRLYRSFKRWAEDNGALSIQMVELLDTSTGLGETLRRMGYKPIEMRYAKSLASEMKEAA